jgi:hypothetical protein
MDVDFTVRLKVRLEKDLDKNDLRLWPYLRVIAPAIQALVRVERRGMHMDQKRLAEVRDAMANKVVELRDELRTISGEQGLNPNAPAQLSKIIYGKLGFNTPSSTPCLHTGGGLNCSARTPTSCTSTATKKVVHTSSSISRALSQVGWKQGCCSRSLGLTHLKAR